MLVRLDLGRRPPLNRAQIGLVVVFTGLSHAACGAPSLDAGVRHVAGVRRRAVVGAQVEEDLVLAVHDRVGVLGAELKSRKKCLLGFRMI